MGVSLNRRAPMLTPNTIVLIIGIPIIWGNPPPAAGGSLQTGAARIRELSRLIITIQVLITIITIL